MRNLLLIVACLFASTGVAQDRLESAYLDSAQKTRSKALAQVQVDEATLRREIAKVAKMPNSKATQQAREGLKAKWAEFEQAKKKLDDLFIGVLDMAQVQTGQVGIMGDGVMPFAVKVTQVTGKNSALILTRGNTYILEADMTDVVDDSFVKIIQPVEVLPPKGYTTVLGASRTVHALRALSNEETLKVFKYANENKPEAIRDLRAWKDLQGKELVTGEFQKREKDKVFIVTKDNETVELSFSKLSREDRLFIQGK